MRNSKLKNSLWMAAALAGSILFTSCDESEEADSNGRALVGVTDAAVDAENITGVYLAVDEIQAKSNSEVTTLVRFDESVEFNVMAYQNGEVFDLGDGELESGTYNELRLILNKEGSYVMYEDGTTVDMEVPSGTSSGYKVKGDFQISANNTTNLVIDIDLRKALVTTGNNADRYILRPTARLVLDGTGMITGQVDLDSVETDSRIVVYAYAEGSFDSSESDEPSEGKARFENSINSAVVADDGTFTLAFMEEGDYELIFSHYEKDETENSYEFKSMVEADLSLDGILLNNLVEVDANTTVDLWIDLNL